MFNNKRGQSLSTGTIILLILGVIVLVVLAIGFIAGWDFFGDLFPSNNVDTVVDACRAQCIQDNSYGYCSQPRELKTDDTEYTASCYTYSVAEEFDIYGIEKCPTLDCTNIQCSEWKYLDEDGNQNEFTIKDLDKKPLELEEVNNYCTK